MSATDVPLPHINIPMVSRQTMAPSNDWYQFMESLFLRTGGQTDFVSENTDSLASLDAAKADKTITVSVSGPISGGGTLGANFSIGFTANTGWTVASGTGNKGAYTVYTAGTASATYVQAELQAVMTALANASARIKALEAALFDRGVIAV